MKTIPRRIFLSCAAGGVLLSPLLGRLSVAQDKASATDPGAQAVSYVEDASSSQHPSFRPGQTCATCKLYQLEQEQDGWAPCPILQSRRVSAKGWCSVWVSAG